PSLDPHPPLHPLPTRRSSDLPPHSALLIVQHGSNAGARFLLDAPRVTAGRDPAADIFLDDVTVSRKHAEFTGEAGQFTVRDVGRSEEHTSELQSRFELVCRLL